MAPPLGRPPGARQSNGAVPPVSPMQQQQQHVPAARRPNIAVPRPPSNNGGRPLAQLPAGNLNGHQQYQQQRLMTTANDVMPVRAVVPATPTSNSGALTVHHGRLDELLGAVKFEFEATVQDAAILVQQRDDLERRVTAQVHEFQSLQRSLYEIERTHTLMRQQYEEEIARLRYELEMRGVHVPPLQPSFPYTEPAMIQQQQHQQFQQAQQDAFAQDFAQQQQPFGTHPQTVSQYGGLPQEQAILLQQGHNHMQQEPHPSLLQHPPHSTLNTSIAPIADGNATANRNKRMRVDDPLQQRQEQPPLERSMLQQLERPTLPAINIIPSQPETSSADCSQLIFGDVEPASIASSHQRQGDDWSIIFNPKLPRNVDTHLAHSFDHDSVVCCVRFSVDGKYLAAGSMRCAVIYDVESGVKLKTLVDLTVEVAGAEDQYVRAVCFSPDGKYLATGGVDSQIRLWDISSGKVHRYFSGHKQDVYALDFSHDGRVIVSGSGDCTTRVWDAVEGRCMLTLARGQSPAVSIDGEAEPKEGSQDGDLDVGVTSVALSPDGTFIAVGSLDRGVRIWNSRTGTFISKLSGHSNSVYSLAFSADGKTLVSGSLDSTLRLWDLSEHVPGDTADGFKCRSVLAGHKDYVLSVAHSQKHNYIISGSRDRSVTCWDGTTAQAMFNLKGHQNSVISVAFCPQGRMFATASGDCKARIWTFDVTNPQPTTFDSSSASLNTSLTSVAEVEKCLADAEVADLDSSFTV